MVASNYKTIDKETKDYCATVSNLIKQRHSDLIAGVDGDKGIVVRAQEGQPEKKKKKKLVQREVLSLATAMTNGDTNKHPMMALNEPIVHDVKRKSPVIATSCVYPFAWPSNLSTLPSMDTLGTFFDSTSSMQSATNHRVHVMDAFNADRSNSGAEFQGSVDPLTWPSNLSSSPSMDTLGTFFGHTPPSLFQHGLSRCAEEHS
jgi:hypothetical protein